MKILHTSDWHLGISLHNISMLDDQKYFINFLFDIIKKEKIEVIIIAGDIFDSSISSSDAINLYNKMVTQICGEMNIPIIIVAGNHDGAARLSSCRELLSSSGLHITGKLEKKITPLIIDNCAFYSIPYFNIEEARVMYPENDISSYEKAMVQICKNIRDTMNKSLKNIIISHSFVSGAELSESDRSAIIGTASMVSKNVFEGFDYTALGHLHRPQSIAYNIRYCGSPIKYSASEVDHIKSFTIIESSDMSLYEIALPSLHNMRIIKDTYENIFNSPIFSEDFIKIEIIDRYISLETLHKIKSFYPNLIELKGKNLEKNDENTLTIDEIENLSPEQLLIKFFKDTLQYSPNNEQLKIFHEALSQSKNHGGDLS